MIVTATIVLAAMFAAPPASAKPVTQTLTIHQCGTLFDDVTYCVDGTQTVKTNFATDGKNLVVQFWYVNDLTTVYNQPGCTSSTAQHSEGYVFAFRTGGQEGHNVQHLQDGTANYVVNCNGTQYECMDTYTWLIFATGDSFEKTVFDRFETTCQPTAA